MKYAENEIKLGELTIDPLTLEVKRDGELIELEPKWVKVLIALATEPNKVLTRKQIIEQVWADYLVGEDSLNRAISKLRKAIEPVSGLEIKTARGVGYQLTYEIPMSSTKKAPRLTGKTLWFSSGIAGIFIIIAAFLIIQNNEVRPAIIATPYQTNITSDLGIEFGPDISPNNKFMTYTWNGGKGSQWNVYVKQIGLEGSKRLTDGPGSDQSSAWSNAGDKIAFFANNGRGWTLSITTFLGTEKRTLFDVGNIWKTTSAITWAGDDMSLVFSARKKGEKYYTLNHIDLNDLSVTALKGENEWDYTMPHFSPDHKLIATVAHRGVQLYLKDAIDSTIGRLQVFEAATGKVVFERTSKEEIASIDWKSNSSLLFTVEGSVNCRIYEVELDKDKEGHLNFDELTPILTIPDVVRAITYNRESGDLYLERWRADVNIWKAKYNQGKITESARAIGSTLFDFNPNLTPDESKLAYLSNKSNIPQVWLHDIESGTSRQVTNLKGYVDIKTIDWSGDGSKMVLSMKKSNENSYAIIVDTLGREIQRIEQGSGVNRAVWSPDNQSLYAILYDAANSGAIWQYEITTKQWSKFSDTAAVYVKNIDNYLYYIKQGKHGLWRAPLSSPENEEIVSKRLPRARADYWTADKDTLKMINLDFEKSFLEIIHIPSQKLLSSSQINNYIPYGQAGASFTKSNEVYFSSIDNYDSDIIKVKLKDD